MKSRKNSRRRHQRGGRSLEEQYFGGGAAFTGVTAGAPDPKVLRLCRQVEQRLALTLGSLSDPVLQSLWVRAVLPLDGGNLLVEVVPGEGTTVDDILARLSAARGLLRSDIAAALHRKRTPHLQFVVVPPHDPTEEDSHA